MEVQRFRWAVKVKPPLPPTSPPGALLTGSLTQLPERNPATVDIEPNEGRPRLVRAYLRDMFLHPVVLSIEILAEALTRYSAR